MPRSRVLIIAGVVIVAAVAIGGFLVYDQVLRGDNVAALSLPSAAPSAAASTATAATDPSGDPTAAPSTGAAASVASGGSTGDVAGTWTVATGSQAGYRVTEQLAQLPAQSDAVGRTDKVTRHDHAHVERLDHDPDCGGPDRRHDVDQLGQVAARQPAAQRGSPDRYLPDRDVQADPAGRGARRGADRDAVATSR